MQCPFKGEETLSQILSERQELNQEIEKKIALFKAILTTPEQKAAFNEIDDLWLQQITFAQHDTVRKIHCPTCRKKNKSCG